jgi:hypothetical protein
MTIGEMHIDFKLELDKTTNLENPAFEPEEIDLWLNKAIRKFVKTRYSGINVKRESFEQTQKRIDDLRSLVVEDTIPCVSGGTKKNCYIADLAGDDGVPVGNPAVPTPYLSAAYWFALSEEVKIAYLSLIDTAEIVAKNALVVGNVYFVVNDDVASDGESYSPGEYFIATSATYSGDGDVIKVTDSIEGVVQCTADTYRAHLDNPYSSHILHYEEASPLRLFIGNIVELITDGSYGVLEYYLRYLRAPETVDSTSGATVDCDLPEHTHDEIVKLAVNMALENIEQPRYQSHMNEVATME